MRGEREAQHELQNSHDALPEINFNTRFKSGRRSKAEEGTKIFSDHF
jgi:hypothetical protein